MSWRRHFRIVSTRTTPHVPQNDIGLGTTSSSTKYASYLPEVYSGHPSRLQRYYQYEDMDRDSDITAALNLIADFCTQSEEQNDAPFETHYTEEANETEVKLLKTYMVKWVKLNNFRSSLWYMFRQCIKNGDQFFLRDPETSEWLWIDHFNVELVKVDETQGKKPDEYIVRNLDYNKQAKFATTKADPSQYRTPLGINIGMGASARPQMNAMQTSPFSLAGASRDPRQMNQVNESMVVDAKHVIHLSLSVGMDINWPFGASILEPVFKVYKQRELLEDSVIIYRVQRAPERRIFYIDCGSMPAPKANAHVERIKNEIHQRRIPNRTGGGMSIMDAAYNPLCLSLDTEIPLLDGRVLPLWTLIDEYKNGKENWVYSCHPVTGKILPGPITWAGVTRHDAAVIKLTFDNDKSIICTPEHKFPVFSKGFVPACELTPTDKLIGFHKQGEHIFDQHRKGWVAVTADANEPTMIAPTSDECARHLVSIEKASNRDVGTITIDGNEMLHDYHTFAVSAGFYLKNSMLDDYFFAQNCLSKVVEIPLLDDRKLQLQDIIKEYEQGKINYVYAQNRETNELEPGKIVWAGVTRRNAQMVRVTLDNGEYIDTTPDHRFIMRNGSEVEAQYLDVGTSLMPLYLKKGRTGPKQKIEKYTQYLSNANHKWEFVHTAIQAKPKGRGHVVHHVDFDSLNNNPENLRVMTWRDHEELHRQVGTYSLTKQWNDPDGRDKLIKGIRKLYDDATDEFKEMLVTRNTKNGAQTWKDETTANRVLQSLAIERAKCAASRALIYTNEMFQRVVQLYTEGYNSISKLCPVLKKDETFQQLFQAANENVKRGKNLRGVGRVDDGTLRELCQANGYDNWDDFKKKFANNHKVVSIEWLTEREDTGDITIETPSGSHIFGLAAGIFVHNSEGRGSKVETLPGGELVGEIGDLEHFNRKLMRGLSIPPSYLPTGTEDSQVAFNDGKLGTAIIQEFRFSKYCMRLQQLLAPIFDREFKRYLRDNGIQIDSGLFELRFLPPQNFTKYRQIEIDAAQMGVFSQISEFKQMSVRYKKKRYLNMTEDELIEDEEMWAEENADKLKKKTGTTPAETEFSDDLGSVGVRSDSGTLPTDLGGEEELEGGDAGLGGQGGQAGGQMPGGQTGGQAGAPPGGGGGPL